MRTLTRQLAIGAMVIAAVAASACKSRTEREPAVVIAPDQPLEARDPAGTAIEHTLSFAAPHTHYVEVTTSVPTAGADTVELMLPVWTPGSYLVREYARHVEGLRAATPAGAPLAVEKSRKNRWRVTTGGADRVVVRYRLYARELTVRTNFVDRDLAVISGAATFLVPVGALAIPHDVALTETEQWPQIGTALPPHPSGDPRRFLAPDYDTLVDSPIVMGTGTSHELEVEGVVHRLATFGGVKVWDDQRAATDVSSLVRTQLELWRVVPYPRYVILNVLENSSGGGGLEHKASTLLLFSPWSTRTRSKYLQWLSLVSHELFHTWNGKRLRPVELGPFDYENEVHTESLWAVEGITSYYDDLLVRRAGVSSHKEYLDALSAQIDSLENTPGREVQALSLSSYDAWIKYYRGDENSVNSSISYYTKGAVVGFLLDAEIRQRSLGRRNLDDMMRLAYQRYAGDQGYTSAQLRTVAEEVAGGSLATFWARYIDGTDALDYAPALAYYGLQFKPIEPPEREHDEDPDETAAWLGADLTSALVVRQVKRGTPAYDAGVNVGDEVIAIEGHRVRDLDRLLAGYRPGDSVELTVARRDELTRLRVELGRKPDDRWKLQIVPGDPMRERGRREDWLGPDR